MKDVDKVTLLPTFTLGVERTPPFILKKLMEAVNKKSSLIQLLGKKQQSVQYFKDLYTKGEHPRSISLGHKFGISTDTEQRFPEESAALRDKFNTTMQTYYKLQTENIIDTLQLEVKRLKEDLDLFLLNTVNSVLLALHPTYLALSQQFTCKITYEQFCEDVKDHIGCSSSSSSDKVHREASGEPIRTAIDDPVLSTGQELIETGDEDTMSTAVDSEGYTVHFLSRKSAKRKSAPAAAIEHSYPEALSLLRQWCISLPQFFEKVLDQRAVNNILAQSAKQSRKEERQSKLDKATTIEIDADTSTKVSDLVDKKINQHLQKFSSQLDKKLLKNLKGRVSTQPKKSPISSRRSTSDTSSPQLNKGDGGRKGKGVVKKPNINKKQNVKGKKNVGAAGKSTTKAKTSTTPRIHTSKVKPKRR